MPTEYSIIGFRREGLFALEGRAGQPVTRVPQLWIRVGKREKLVQIGLEAEDVRRLLKELVALL